MLLLAVSVLEADVILDVKGAKLRCLVVYYCNCSTTKAVIRNGIFRKGLGLAKFSFVSGLLLFPLDMSRLRRW